MQQSEHGIEIFKGDKLKGLSIEVNSPVKYVSGTVISETFEK